MKLRVLVVIIAAMLLFSIPVSAHGYEYTISPSSDFTQAKSGDDLTELAKELNISADNLNAYFTQNQLIYFAVSNSSKSQIKISVNTDSFSSQVADISQLSDEALDEFAKIIVPEGTLAIVTNGDRKFICTKSVNSDNDTPFTVTQYITICDNQTFYITGYNEGSDTSDEIITAFQSFSIKQLADDSSKNITKHSTLDKILVWGGVGVFSALAVIMSIGITRSIKQKNED